MPEQDPIEQRIAELEKVCVTPDLNYNVLRRALRDAVPLVIAALRKAEQERDTLQVFKDSFESPHSLKGTQCCDPRIEGDIVALLEENKRLKQGRDEAQRDSESASYCLCNLRAWLRHWVTRTISQQSKDERGYVTNSWAACPIPDWDVKQKLDDIDAALAALSDPSTGATREADSAMSAHKAAPDVLE